MWKLSSQKVRVRAVLRWRWRQVEFGLGDEPSHFGGDLLEFWAVWGGDSGSRAGHLSSGSS